MQHYTWGSYRESSWSSRLKLCQTRTKAESLLSWSCLQESQGKRCLGTMHHAYILSSHILLQYLQRWLILWCSHRLGPRNLISLRLSYAVPAVGAGCKALTLPPALDWTTPFTFVVSDTHCVPYWATWAPQWLLPVLSGLEASEGWIKTGDQSKRKSSSVIKAQPFPDWEV